MRASTLFAIVVASLLGLGAVVTANHYGLFAPKNGEPPKKEEPIMVLVAAKNLYPEIALQQTDVKVRALHPSEREAREEHRQNPGKFLPAVTTAAALLIPNHTIQADTPLRHDFFQKPKLPEGLQKVLAPGMRAVNVAVMKENAAGGVIRVGERVDVFLTSRITFEPNNRDFDKTALIAKDCKVVMKRNIIYPVIAPVPDDKPVAFTLQANPYRAALIRFAQGNGELSLVPAAESELPPNDGPPFKDPSSEEFKDEDERVKALAAGTLTVGDADLERIFKLKRPTPPPAPQRIELRKGVGLAGERFVYADGRIEGTGGLTGDTDRTGGGGATRTDGGRQAARDAASDAGGGFSFCKPAGADDGGGGRGRPNRTAVDADSGRKSGT